MMTDTDNSGKKWHRSKTVRFNLLVTVLAAVEINLNLLKDLIDVDVYQVLMFVLVIGNTVLRFMTNEGLKR